MAAELWSATSYKRLREQALTTERWNRLHPDQAARTPRVTELLDDGEGPIVAVTDFMKAVPDQIARWVPAGRRFVPLGTDGFGRSDTREALRRHFETDAPHVVVATLAGAGGERRREARGRHRRHRPLRHRPRARRSPPRLAVEEAGEGLELAVLADDRDVDPGHDGGAVGSGGLPREAEHVVVGVDVAGALRAWRPGTATARRRPCRRAPRGR